MWQMIEAIAESVTAIGVFLAGYQLLLTKKAIKLNLRMILQRSIEKL
jgi:hypothetical protein